MTEPKTEKPRRWGMIDTVVSLALLVGGAYLWLGFRPGDPYLLRFEGGILAFLLPIATSIGIPLIVIGSIILWWAYKTNRVPRAAIALAVIGSILGGLIAFPVVAHYYYKRTYLQDMREFHPYLQMTPNAIMIRPASSDSLQPFRIFCLGGSTTEWTDKDGRGWPDRVEQHLRGAFPGRDIQLYNCGKMWYTTQHMVIHYEANIRPLKPDMIIAMEAINDLSQNTDFAYLAGGEFREDYGHFYGPIAKVVNRQPLIATTAGLVKANWHTRPRTEINTDSFPGVASYERNLRLLVELARLDSIPILLMTQPFLAHEGLTAEERDKLAMINFEAVGPGKKWGMETAISGMNQYAETVRRTASESGTLFLDLESMVPKSLEYFLDDVHYRTKGYDL
ncbi:MAG: SGNH/GDSL hydrolase family protein, partial [Candidatus Zixiibacteriota bacterium]